MDTIYGAAGRSTLFWYDPHKLTIVGVDSPDDPDNPLTDEDRTRHGFDEAKVETIIEMGVIVPITFRKNGKTSRGRPICEVVVGRDRVLSAREAWRRMRAAGVKTAALPLVPAILSKGSSQADLQAIQMVENMVRRPETPLSSARKAERFYRMTKDIEKTARFCGVKKKTARAWIELLDVLSPGAQAWVERGDVSATRAVELLRDIQQEAQVRELERLRAEGKLHGAAAQSEVLRKRRPQAEGEEAPALPGKRAVRGFREVLCGASAAGSAERPESLTLDQVGNLLDFLLDGKPLVGPLRRIWDQMLAK